MRGKVEIPGLEEDVGNIKFIGEYLEESLNVQGIYTCLDLVEALIGFGDVHEDPLIVKRRVREWLRLVLTNARANECCYPRSKVIDGSECSYLARPTNQKGYNAILKVWRYYTDLPFRNWIPASFRGLNDRNKYPVRCTMEV